MIFGPGIVFWMDNVLYREKLESLSPKALAPNVNVPVLLIHGEKDITFPSLCHDYCFKRKYMWILSPMSFEWTPIGDHIVLVT